MGEFARDGLLFIQQKENILENTAIDATVFDVTTTVDVTIFYSSKQVDTRRS